MFTKLLVSLWLFCAAAGATAVQFVNVGSGVNNGAAYVGPYNLLVDGVETPGTCISPTLEVAPPFQWEANLDPITDFADAVQTQLLKAAWLTEQFVVSADTAAIHQAIWNLFGSNYADADTLSWAAAADAGFSSVDAARFAVLVPTDHLTQSFLIESRVPEPRLWWTVPAILVVGLRRGKTVDGTPDTR